MSLTEFDQELYDRNRRREGILEGKEEAARNMLADGLSPEKIVQYTGLSLEDVTRLSEELAVTR